MKRDDDEKPRAEENASVIARMRSGHNLCHTDLGAFRWAPRPTIKKDEKAIAALYGDAKREVKS